MVNRYEKAITSKTKLQTNIISLQCIAPGQESELEKEAGICQGCVNKHR